MLYEENKRDEWERSRSFWLIKKSSSRKMMCVYVLFHYTWLALHFSFFWCVRKVIREKQPNISLDFHRLITSEKIFNWNKQTNERSHPWQRSSTCTQKIDTSEEEEKPIDVVSVVFIVFLPVFLLHLWNSLDYLKNRIMEFYRQM